jgi:hypothetical protein
MNPTLKALPRLRSRRRPGALRALYWLHPGLGVKRWLLLVILGALAVAMGEPS